MFWGLGGIQIQEAIVNSYSKIVWWLLARTWKWHELSYLEITVSNGTYEEGLWGIATKSELAPDEEEAEKYAKFVARRNRALATIAVIAVSP